MAAMSWPWPCSWRPAASRLRSQTDGRGGGAGFRDRVDVDRPRPLAFFFEPDRDGERRAAVRVAIPQR
jgi:hypothetical protein